MSCSYGCIAQDAPLPTDSFSSLSVPSLTPTSACKATGIRNCASVRLKLWQVTTSANPTATRKTSLPWEHLGPTAWLGRRYQVTLQPVWTSSQIQPSAEPAAFCVWMYLMPPPPIHSCVDPGVFTPILSSPTHPSSPALSSYRQQVTSGVISTLTRDAEKCRQWLGQENFLQRYPWAFST